MAFAPERVADSPFTGAQKTVDAAWREQAGDLITGHTALVSPPACPELRLHLGADIDTVWAAAENILDTMRVPTPFWSVAWVGGQALARHLLDRPQLVAGRRVLDVGAGSGIVAIAAARGGARRVTAVDLDPLARVAMALNAAANAVDVAISDADPLTMDAGIVAAHVDVIVAGDLWYERQTAERVTPWLRRMAAAGMEVLVGDKRRAFFPRTGLRRLGRYHIATPENLEPGTISEAGVWQVLAAPEGD